MSTSSQWTNQHQMTINGKRNHFSLSELVTVGDSISLPNSLEIVQEVIDIVARWPLFAGEAGVDPDRCAEIGRCHRLNLK